MKKIVLVATALIFMVGCETGRSNQSQKVVEIPSGIVDKYDVQKSSYKSNSSVKDTTHRIFSNSAQPGFYLQYAVFEKYRPTKSFLAPLTRSRFPYIVLNKSSKDYVLVGPYKSYNEAKRQTPSIKSTLHKQTFVVEVRRP